MRLLLGCHCQNRIVKPLNKSKLLFRKNEKEKYEMSEKLSMDNKVDSFNSILSVNFRPSNKGKYKLRRFLDNMSNEEKLKEFVILITSGTEIMEAAKQTGVNKMQMSEVLTYISEVYKTIEDLDNALTGLRKTKED
jgi:hypothetical protein